jgi:hypothetical protein
MTPKYSEDASKKLISFQKTALLVVTPLAVEMSPEHPHYDVILRQNHKNKGRVKE